MSRNNDPNDGYDDGDDDAYHHPPRYQQQQQQYNPQDHEDQERNFDVEGNAAKYDLKFQDEPYRGENPGDLYKRGNADPLPIPGLQRPGLQRDTTNGSLEENDQSLFSGHDDATMPGVLQLLLLCSNATAPNSSKEEDRAEAEESWEPVREWLRNHTGDEVRQAAEQKDDSSRTALHLACRNQPPIDVIHVFLSVALDTIQWTDMFGWLPLHYASAYLADLKVIKTLTESFPPGKTTVDDRGRTPLHLVLGNGNRNNEMLAAHGIVAVLSSSGAAEHADYNGMIPLHYACAYGASEEALYVLTGAHSEGIYARDRNGRTPLHFALSNAGNEASPTAVKHLLELEPDLANNSGGVLPLRVLADFAYKFKSPGGDPTRESVQMCLAHLLNANPHPSPDFFTALQSLPVWLVERAVVLPKVQVLLNDKLSQRFPTAFNMADLIFIVIVFIFYYLNVRDSLEKRFVKVELDQPLPIVSISMKKLMPLFAGIVYFAIREMVQMISFISMNAFSIWLFDVTSWLNILYISLMCFWTIMMSTGGLYEVTGGLYNEDDEDANRRYIFLNKVFREGNAISVLIVYFKLAVYLRQNVQTFAVFFGAIIFILRRLVIFLLAMITLLLAFTEMFLTEKLYTDDYICYCLNENEIAYIDANCAAECGNNYTDTQCQDAKDDAKDDYAYCNFFQTLLHMLTMLLGEVNDTEFSSSPFDTIFFILFMTLMVVIFATVLIAIVTDSYKIIQNNRSAIVFWTNRLHFVAQVDAISRGFQNKNLRKRIGMDTTKSQHEEGHSSGSAFGKEFWKSMMDLFDDEIEEGIMSTEFWIVNILRFFTATVIIPSWLILGVFSLGWLWPPQLRKKFTMAPVSEGTEASEDELRKTQVLLLGKEVKQLKDEITHEITLDRIQVVQMKSTIADKRAEIANEMRHIKRIMTMLFDQQAQQ